MNKRISVLLASLLTVTLLTCSASAMTFPDVDSGSDYSTAVEYISELGLIIGDTEGNFNPSTIVTRAEMATIICRMLNQTENLSTSDVFTDVPVNHWANAYVGKASELGIVSGYGGGMFGPSDPVTYEQAVTMIIRAIGKEDSAIAFSGYPSGYLLVAETNSLLKGIQAVQGQGLSRGSVAVLLYNYYTTQNNSATPEDGHTHHYITMTVPGSGHYEQVQVGTEKVQVGTETRQYSKCLVCGGIQYTNEEMYGHSDPSSPYYHPGCEFSRNLIYTESVPVYEEQPKYESVWVEDTIRVCSICGQEEP